eukprot:9319329-Pyramimonas_sp.AAC.2
MDTRFVTKLTERYGAGGWRVGLFACDVVAAINPEGPTKYSIAFHTGTQLGAGTDATVTSRAYTYYYIRLLISGVLGASLPLLAQEDP